LQQGIFLRGFGMNRQELRRIWIDRIVFGIVALCAMLAFCPLIWLVFDLFINGYKQIQFDFFTQVNPTSQEADLFQSAGLLIPGGIFNGITGSFLVIAIAVALATPLGVLAALFMYDNHSLRFLNLFHSLIVSMSGIPSVVVGMVVYLWMVEPFQHFSALAGGVSLALVMLPMIIYTTLNALETLPENIKEEGAALGGTCASVIFQIVLPVAKDRIISGILVAVSRAVGITSPLIITALGASEVHWHINERVSTVSMLIWSFFNDSSMVGLVWATALFLFLVVIVLNIIAKSFYHEQSLHT
jgi:phosphate transport system permease protein